MAVRKAGTTKTRTRPVALLFVAALGFALPHALCSAVALFSRCSKDLGLRLSSVQADPEELLLRGKMAVLLELVLLPSAAVHLSCLSLLAPEPFEVIALEGPHPTAKDHDAEQQPNAGPSIPHHPVC